MSDQDAAPPLPGRILGVAHEYQDLIALVRGRIAELGISYEVMDAVTGLPQGYSGKLLANPPIKKLGVLSLGCVMGALGLAIIIAEDPAQTLRIRPRLELRKRALHAVNGLKRTSGHG